MASGWPSMRPLLFNNQAIDLGGIEYHRPGRGPSSQRKVATRHHEGWMPFFVGALAIFNKLTPAKCKETEQSLQSAFS